MVLLHTYVAIGEVGKLPHAYLMCHLETKFQRLYTFSGVSFLLVTMPIFHSKIQDGAPKKEVVLILARVVVSERYLSQLSCLPGRQISQTRIHLDVTFQDGGGKSPQPYRGFVPHVTSTHT